MRVRLSKFSMNPILLIFLSMNIFSAAFQVYGVGGNCANGEPDEKIVDEAGEERTIDNFRPEGDPTMSTGIGILQREVQPQEWSRKFKWELFIGSKSKNNQVTGSVPGNHGVPHGKKLIEANILISLKNLKLKPGKKK